jgi:hypothetical protein
MATVLEVYTAEEQYSVLRSFMGKRLNAQDIHKEMFHVYGGKCFHVKRFTSESRNSLKKFDARPNAEGAETTVKRLLCCGFRCTGKAMGQVYKCWWTICREINVLSRFEYHMLYVLYPFVTYFLTLACIYKLSASIYFCLLFYVKLKCRF